MLAHCSVQSQGSIVYYRLRVQWHQIICLHSRLTLEITFKSIHFLINTLMSGLIYFWKRSPDHRLMVISALMKVINFPHGLQTEETKFKYWKSNYKKNQKQKHKGTPQKRSGPSVSSTSAHRNILLSLRSLHLINNICPHAQNETLG